MEDRLRKTERVWKIWLLLNNNPFYFTTKALAERCGVNVKTIYRDLVTLDIDLHVPVEKRGTRWGIAEGHFLPPIQFSVPEALTIFLAARLMLNYANRYDPFVDSAFIKLNATMPAPLKQQIQKTLDWMQKLPKDDKYLRIIAALADAWVNRSQVKISYQALEAQERSERVIEPYFIEPAAAGHASYVIAYCHRSKGVRTFKIERIESINILNETFDIPPNFDANNYLGHSLGIGVGEKVRTIKLKFAPELSRLMEETIWHPSQKLERQTDNSAIMTLQVFDTPELKSWILGWGDKVEVLGPQKLRREIITSSSRTLSLYSRSVG